MPTTEPKAEEKLTAVTKADGERDTAELAPKVDAEDTKDHDEDEEPAANDEEPTAHDEEPAANDEEKKSVSSQKVSEEGRKIFIYNVSEVTR